jgi:hypothetical protein
LTSIAINNLCDLVIRCGDEGALHLTSVDYLLFQHAELPLHRLKLVTHGVHLPPHDGALLTRIMSTDPYSNHTDGRGGPKASDAKMLPAPIALLLGSLLIVGSLKFLFYALERGGKLLCPTGSTRFPPQSRTPG